MKVWRVASHTLRGRVLTVLLFWAACHGPFSQLAKASFIGQYSVDHFAVIDFNGPGAFLSPDNGLSVVITGPNNGSGLEGYTDVTTTILHSGLIQFQYTYSSLDTPGYDYAGYFLGSVFIKLADTDGQSAMILAPVNAGDLFGFRVGTLDNTGEPGVFTVFDFSGPSNDPTGAIGGGGTGGEVPEPRSSVLVLAAVIAGLARGKRKRKVS